MFRVYFNRKRQWVEVTLWSVHPNTFEKWGNGRWAYWEPKWELPNRGKFGELHFVQSRLRFDTIAHELFHLIVEWLWANRTNITATNEEKLATLFDELCRRTVREIRRLHPDIKL